MSETANGIVCDGCHDTGFVDRKECVGLPGSFRSVKRCPSCYGIKCHAIKTGSGPVPHDPAWDATHWEVTLELSGGETMTVPFYTGPGITDQPDARAVLACLLSDALLIENDDEGAFDGLPFSRARALLDRMAAQTRTLRDFLGDDYEAAMYDNLFGTDDQ